MHSCASRDHVWRLCMYGCAWRDVWDCPAMHSCAWGDVFPVSPHAQLCIGWSCRASLHAQLCMGWSRHADGRSPHGHPMHSPVPKRPCMHSPESVKSPHAQSLACWVGSCTVPDPWESPHAQPRVRGGSPGEVQACGAAYARFQSLGGASQCRVLDLRARPCAAVHRMPSVIRCLMHTVRDAAACASEGMLGSSAKPWNPADGDDSRCAVVFVFNARHESAPTCVLGDVSPCTVVGSQPMHSRWKSDYAQPRDDVPIPPHAPAVSCSACLFHRLTLAYHLIHLRLTLAYHLIHPRPGWEVRLVYWDA